ncbi:hypothetical protein BKA00_006843 [Actinomadura coerulea]|uniref:Uncharacterized protein n=2 Tax=Actinomadura coerulea TaxID=46159 RepID=A0A7X0G671_9ACTN|nr:hypothetical protein [Actinomadura coerulea]
MIMPMAYEVAMGLRLTHRGTTFWCGTWLGGCGSQIMTKIGRRKVPHFAHYPEMARKCRRANLDDSSADHLFINRDLKNWLGTQGIAVRRPQFLGDIEQQGTCIGLLLETRDAKRTIAVVLDDRDTEKWKRLYDEFRTAHKPVDWLYSPTSRNGRALTSGQGTGLLAMCQYVDGERRLRVGARDASGRIRWADLADCRISGTGIVHPDAAPAKPEPQLSRPAGQFRDMRPPGASPTREQIADYRRAANGLLMDANAALSRGDRDAARTAVARLRQVLDTLGDDYMERKFRILALRAGGDIHTVETGSGVVPTLGRTLLIEAEVSKSLDAAFDALRKGHIESAKRLHGRVAETLTGTLSLNGDLQRRSRSCAAQIRDTEQRRREAKRVLPPAPGATRNLHGSGVPKQASASEGPDENTPGRPMVQQVAAMKRRLRMVSPSGRLRRDLHELLIKLPRHEFPSDRRLFETYLLQHWPVFYARAASTGAVRAMPEILSPAGRQRERQSKATSVPRARCSCGWEGKPGRFTRHTTLPALQGKVHTRLA